jgi:NADH-quinone oxidoreductase subunit M
MGILTFFILIPLLTMAAVIAAKKPEKIKTITTGGLSLQAFLSLLLLILYLLERSTGNSEEMLFAKDIFWFRSLNIHYAVGADGLTVLMLALSSLAALAAILPERSDRPAKEFIVSLLLVVSASSGFIVSVDLLLSFVFIVIFITALFFMQGIFGKSPNKSLAVKQILILMGGAGILLTGLLGVYMNSAPDGNEPTLNVLLVSKYLMPVPAQKVFFTMVFSGFCVLGALFPFSILIPGNFSVSSGNAPVIQSLIMMKLGAYGAFRAGIAMMPEGAREMSWIFLIIAAATVVYGAAGVFTQKSPGKLHAYASLSFSGLIFFSLLLMNEKALSGALLMIFSHGLAVSLFLVITWMIYARTMVSETEKLNQPGILLPVLSVFYFIAALCLAGIPGTAGFQSFKEIAGGIFQEDDPVRKISGVVVLVTMAAVVLFILVQSVRMTIVSFRGRALSKEDRLTPREKVSISLLLIPAIVAGVMPAAMVSLIEPNLKPLIMRLIENNPF